MLVCSLISNVQTHRIRNYSRASANHVSILRQFFDTSRLQRLRFDEVLGKWQTDYDISVKGWNMEL